MQVVPILIVALFGSVGFPAQPQGFGQTGSLRTTFNVQAPGRKNIRIGLPSDLSPTVWWAPKAIQQVRVSVPLLGCNLAALRLCAFALNSNCMVPV